MECSEGLVLWLGAGIGPDLTEIQTLILQLIILCGMNHFIQDMPCSWSAVDVDVMSEFGGSGPDSATVRHAEQ